MSGLWLSLVSIALATLTFSYCIQVEKNHSNGPLTLYIKGAPERVLAKCNSFLKGGEQFPISEEFRKDYDNAYDVRHIHFYISYYSSSLLDSTWRLVGTEPSLARNCCYLVTLTPPIMNSRRQMISIRLQDIVLLVSSLWKIPRSTASAKPLVLFVFQESRS